MPKFSIILPVRNGSNYIRECITSILAQTYTDFELLILENASTDDTSQIIQSFNHEKIKIITAKKLLNIEENWARAAETPKAEFMTLIGHDDLLKPDFLETINELIDTYPDATLYHTHFNFIDPKGKIIRACKPMPPTLQLSQLLKGFLDNTIDSMGTGYVMRSADYDRIGGISVKYPNLLFADFDLWLQLAALGYEAVAKENSFSFRVHQSVTSSSADAKLHKGLEVFTDSLVQLKTNNAECAEIIDEYGSIFLTRLAKSYSHRILRTPKNKRGKVSVAGYINDTKQLARKLGIEKKFKPEEEKTIWIAKLIDENRFLGALFFLARKIYGKPFYN